MCVMNLVDHALKLLEPVGHGRHWTIDWSALPVCVAAELLAGQDDRTFMSSGTTGEPKALTRSAQMLVRELDATIAVIGRDNDWVHTTVNPRSMYGYMATYIGARLGVPTTFDEWGMTRQPISGTKPLIFTVPISWRSLRPRLDDTTSASVTIVHAGSTLPPASLSYAEHRSAIQDVHLIDLFGTTETGLIGIRRAHPEGDTTWTICTDTVLTYPKLDEEGEARPVVTSPRVAGGSDSGTVRSVRLDDWLMPATQGSFGFRGRRERLVKPGGRQVDLDLLEAQVSALVPEFEIACVPRIHPELGEDVELLIVAPVGSEIDILSRLRGAPAASLTFVPRWVNAVNDIPRSAMGKVRRVASGPIEETAA
jgi:acyl-coenzyme A synthetase/AMP-(fatty) acid ligase